MGVVLSVRTERDVMGGAVVTALRHGALQIKLGGRPPMPKALLMIDAPESCYACQLRTPGDRWCSIDKTVYTTADATKITDGCPLVVLPEKGLELIKLGLKGVAKNAVGFEVGDVNDYAPMCRSCHRKYDNAKNREGVVNHA
jgi:hypothetical protein